MTPDKLKQRMYTGRAMQAKTETEMLEVIRMAMSDGMEQGWEAKQSEIQEALHTLGFGDLAFKSEWELQT